MPQFPTDQYGFMERRGGARPPHSGLQRLPVTPAEHAIALPLCSSMPGDWTPLERYVHGVWRGDGTAKLAQSDLAIAYRFASATHCATILVCCFLTVFLCSRDNQPWMEWLE
eukprot:COSAG03_NODE_1630_length_3744_cov_5.585185_4_plen_112_part_00